MHAHISTIRLFQHMMGRTPALFPVERRREMELQLARFWQNAKTPREKIEDAIAHFGHMLWPYRKAWWSMHDAAMRQKEKRLLVQALQREDLRKKVQSFLRGQNAFDAIHRGTRQFTGEFTPSERQAILVARIDAHHVVRKEMDAVCLGKKRKTYLTFVREFQREQREIDGHIGKLRRLAERTHRYRDEIIAFARRFEFGWAGLEPEMTDAEVAAAIAYYEEVMKGEKFLGST